MSIMDSYERACVAASAKSIGDLAKKTAQGLKPMPTGDPICGACKHWDSSVRPTNWAFVVELGGKLCGNCTSGKFEEFGFTPFDNFIANSLHNCFELWEEET